MKLTELEFYFFSQLWGLLDLNDTLNLWICGDVRLQQHMRRTIRHFNLCYAAQQQYKFPSLLNQLDELTEVSLSYRSSSVGKFVHGIQLEALPETIEVLDLQIVNGLQSLTSTTSRLNDVAPHPLDLNLVSLSKWFPRLHTLKFRNGYDIENLVTFSSFFENLALLSLTTLQFSGLPIDGPTLSGLPRALTSLECTLHIQQPEIAEFPPNLVFLNLGGSCAINLLETIPKTVTDLSLMSPGLVAGSVKSDFPPNLVRLFLAYHTIWTTQAVQNLPRTLTSLHLGAHNMPWEALPAFPPNLEFFTMIDHPLLKGTPIPIAIHLPRHLKTMPYLGDIPCEDWIHLPRSLTQLPFRVSEAQSHYIPCLPPHLTTILMTPAPLPPRILAGRLAPLATPSTSLGLESSVKWPFISLTELLIEAASAQVRYQYFDLSPLSELPTLTKLHLRAFADLEQLHQWKCHLKQFNMLQGNPNEVPFRAPCFSSLYRLQFGPPAVKSIVDHESLFSALPTTVRYLTMAYSWSYGPGIPRASPSAIALLPPLKELSIRATVVNEEVFKALPPHLEKLELFCNTSSEYSAYMLHSLPLSLVCIDLPSTTGIRSAEELIPFIERRKRLYKLFFDLSPSSFTATLKRLLRSSEGSVSLYASIMTQALRQEASKASKKKAPDTSLFEMFQ